MKRMMIGILLGCGLFLSSCHSIYMSAEDRLQENYEAMDESVELETLDELYALSYSNVSVIPYTVENIARGFTDLTEDEIQKYKQCDEHNQKTLVVPERKIDIQFSYGNIDFYFYAVDREDAQKYLNVTQPEYHERVFSFAELKERFPEKNLEELSREEAIQICDRAVSEAKISAVFENAFAMDCETLNKLQEEATRKFGEGFYVAPGSTDIQNEDGTTKWDIKQWTKDQEAYYVVYRMQAEGKTVDASGYNCRLEMFCRADGQIIYAKGAYPTLDFSNAKSEKVKILSSKEIYSMAKDRLRQRQLENSEIVSVKLCYGKNVYIAVPDENVEETKTSVIPCWEVTYLTDVSGTKVKDYLYLDAITGLEVVTNVY